MKALARALINAAAYLDLSGDEGLDADLTLQALEEIAYNLSHCTEAEKAALRDVLADMRSAEQETGPRAEFLEFLNNFLASFGLEDEEDVDGDSDDIDGANRINLL